MYGPKKVWIAYVFEKSNGGNPPIQNRFDLGEFVFLHEAESMLKECIKHMPQKFCMNFVVFNFGLGGNWSFVISNLEKV